MYLYLYVHRGGCQNTVKISLLALTISIAVITASCLTEQIYYVTPNTTTVCPSTARPGACQTLRQYVSKSEEYFQSDTTFYFLSGTHWLDIPEAVIITGNINALIFISNLRMIGDSRAIPSTQSFTQLEPSAVISCNSSASGFVFGFVQSLEIANLSFIHCSADISKVSHYIPQQEYLQLQNVTVTLGFLFVENLHLSGVLVQNNTGYGLGAVNLLGNSSVVDSIFVFNRGDEYHPGGNAVVYFLLDILTCALFPDKTALVNLNIASSKFMYGSTAGFTGFPPPPPGLSIVLYQHCSHVSVHINNSLLSDNQKGEEVVAVHGANLAIDIIHPNNPASHSVVIDNCHIEGGRADLGGGMSLYAFTSSNLTLAKLFCAVNNSYQVGSVHIVNTEIVRNAAVDVAGGLAVVINLCYKYTIQIKNTTFSGNSLGSVGESSKSWWPQELRSIGGGNLGVYLGLAHYHSISIEDCTFSSGVAQYGGAIAFAASFPPLEYHARHPYSTELISVSNTKFFNNSASNGGAVWVDLMSKKVQNSMKSHTTTASVVKISNCTFANNTGYLGAALAFTSERTYSTFTDLPTSTHVNLKIQNTSFENNQSPNEDIVLPILNYKLTPTTITRSAVYLYDIQNISFANCQFRKNYISGLLAEKSNVFLEDDNIFYNNSGVRGGGIFLLYSYLFPRMNTKISFVHNRASEVGGAVYIKEELSPYGNYPCPIRPDIPPGMPYNETGIMFEFNNNTAKDTGASIYGGYLDTCNTESYKDLNRPVSSDPLSKSSELNSLLHFTNNRSEVSEISSDPVGVCFCDGSLQNCTQKLRSIKTFPGAQFNVTVLTVGQRNGFVRGVVRAALYNSSVYHSLGKSQDSQSVDRFCTNLTYSVLSNNSVEYLQLTVENPSELFGYLFNPPTISIQLLSCPLGFSLQGIPPECGCSSILKDEGITCDINTQTIHRPAGIWVGYSNTNAFPSQMNISRKITVHKHCPFDYCIQRDNDINLEYPDEQCDFNRSGVLCGQCSQGFSMVLGSNRCRKCENKYLSLLLAFGVAGLVLVAFLIVCNLTVADGTLSGLVLYANIVQANRSSFLPCEANSTDDIVLKSILCKLSYLTSWLSLDLGIETCFYDGMDMYSKAWLQFVFPVYIWVIVILIITASHYSSRASRLFGRNAPKVLATLFLLSYTKILDAVFTAFSFTFLDNGRQVVWLYDGNIEYFRGKHIPLVILAALFVLAFLVPYTIVVLCIQCLQKRSWYRLLGWVRRLKPLLDAYTGPYKDKYRFWTGLLLVVRFILLLVYACNAQGDASLNVLLTGVAASCLLAVEWAFMGIYRNWLLDLLEGSFLLNIAILSAATLYTETVKGDQTIVAFISIIITCAMLVGILIFHVKNRFRNLRCTRTHLHEVQRQYITNSTTTILAENDSDQINSSIDQPSVVQPLCLMYDRDGEGGFILVSET